MRMTACLLLMLASLHAAAQMSSAVTAQVGEQAAQTASFTLERVCDTLSILRLGDSAWPLPFPVYRFETADVNGDGSTDAIVGVIKRTRYDPEVRRRVFVFKNYRGHVRPLWLGSRLGQPVADFRFIARDGVLRVLETERSGLFLVAEYRWRAFGMEFVRYLGREMTEENGRRLLDTPRPTTHTQ